MYSVPVFLFVLATKGRCHLLWFMKQVTPSFDSQKKERKNAKEGAPAFNLDSQKKKQCEEDPTFLSTDISWSVVMHSHSYI